MFRTYLVRAAEVVVVLTVLALIAGVVLGQPVLFSFVTSDSMSPTIQEGDGFVVVPDQLTGDIDEGDVVVFQSQEIEGGELTTHRIVGETDRGYITKGDGNPFTDQDGVEPPVTESQIVATAWQPGGRIVRIPSLGTAILGTRAFVFEVQASVAAAVGVEGADNAQEVGGALFLSGLVLLVLTTVNQFRRGTSRDRSRTRGQDTVDPRYAVIFLIAIVVVPANLAMVSPSTTHEISTAEIAQGSGVGPGETAEAKLSARNGGAVTMLVVFEPPADVTLNSRQLEVVGGGTASTTMFVPVPSSGEERTVRLPESRYIVVLPPSLLLTLHDIHPLVALGAINGALVFSIVALVFGLVGVRKRRTRDTGRDIPLSVRIKRALR